jgi:hypothetical protein
MAPMRVEALEKPGSSSRAVVKTPKVGTTIRNGMEE